MIVMPAGIEVRTWDTQDLGDAGSVCASADYFSLQRLAKNLSCLENGINCLGALLCRFSHVQVTDLVFNNDFATDVQAFNCLGQGLQDLDLADQVVIVKVPQVDCQIHIGRVPAGLLCAVITVTSVCGLRALGLRKGIDICGCHCQGVDHSASGCSQMEGDS